MLMKLCKSIAVNPLWWCNHEQPFFIKKKKKIKKHNFLGVKLFNFIDDLARTNLHF